MVSKAIGWKMCVSEMLVYFAFFLSSAALAPAPGVMEHEIKLVSEKVFTIIASQTKHRPSFHWKRAGLAKCHCWYLPESVFTGKISRFLPVAKARQKL